MDVPGVVEAVYGEIIAALSLAREHHRLGLRQTVSPFISIRTVKKMLETLFDLLEGIFPHVCKYWGFYVSNAESFIAMLVSER